MGAIRGTAAVVGLAATFFAVILVLAVLDEPQSIEVALSTVPAKLLQIVIILSVLVVLAITLIWLTVEPTASRLMLGVSRACTAGLYASFVAAPSIWSLTEVKIHTGQWSAEVHWGEPILAALATTIVCIIGAIFAGREFAHHKELELKSANRRRRRP